jgi:hypothetical protein
VEHWDGVHVQALSQQRLPRSEAGDPLYLLWLHIRSFCFLAFILLFPPFFFFLSFFLSFSLCFDSMRKGKRRCTFYAGSAAQANAVDLGSDP